MRPHQKLGKERSSSFVSCELADYAVRNHPAAVFSGLNKILSFSELESLKKQNEEMEKELNTKGQLIAALTKAMHNQNKVADDTIEALKKKVAELEQQKSMTSNDGTEVGLSRTEINEKNLKLAAITEQFLLTAKTGREAQLEVQKLSRERILLFDHIKKSGIYVDGGAVAAINREPWSRHQAWRNPQTPLQLVINITSLHEFIFL